MCLWNVEDSSITVWSCTILHNLCSHEGESETDFELSSPPQSQDSEFEQDIDAKRIRLALLKYVNLQWERKKNELHI